MSKSLGNVYTLRDLFKKNFSAQVIRYFLISVHYRQKADLSFKKLEAAKNSLKRIQEFIGNLRYISVAQESFSFKLKDLLSKILKKAEDNFRKSMDDDLNTPKALAVLFDLIKAVNKLEGIDKKSATKILMLLKKFDSVFGLNLLESAEKEDKLLIPENVMELIRQREIARKEKDWKKSDELREEIKKLGYQIEDTSFGPKIKTI